MDMLEILHQQNIIHERQCFFDISPFDDPSTPLPDVIIRINRHNKKHFPPCCPYTMVIGNYICYVLIGFVFCFSFDTILRNYKCVQFRNTRDSTITRFLIEYIKRRLDKLGINYNKQKLLSRKLDTWKLYSEEYLIEIIIYYFKKLKQYEDGNKQTR